jgi:hypothetical protein
MGVVNQITSQLRDYVSLGIDAMTRNELENLMAAALSAANLLDKFQEEEDARNSRPA